MSMILRVIGGLIGLGTIGIFIWDFFETGGISDDALVILPTGIILALYAFGGKPLLKKIVPRLADNIFSVPRKEQKKPPLQMKP